MKDSPLWRAVWWGQAGNLIAFTIGLAGVTDKNAFIWGVIVTGLATVIGG